MSGSKCIPFPQVLPAPEFLTTKHVFFRGQSIEIGGAWTAISGAYVHVQMQNCAACSVVATRVYSHELHKFTPPLLANDTTISLVAKREGFAESSIVELSSIVVVPRISEVFIHPACNSTLFEPTVLYMYVVAPRWHTIKFSLVHEGVLASTGYNAYDRKNPPIIGRTGQLTVFATAAGFYTSEVQHCRFQVVTPGAAVTDSLSTDGSDLVSPLDHSRGEQNFSLLIAIILLSAVLFFLSAGLLSPVIAMSISLVVAREVHRTRKSVLGTGISSNTSREDSIFEELLETPNLRSSKLSEELRTIARLQEMKVAGTIFLLKQIRGQFEGHVLDARLDGPLRKLMNTVCMDERLMRQNARNLRELRRICSFTLYETPGRYRERGFMESLVKYFDLSHSLLNYTPKKNFKEYESSYSRAALGAYENHLATFNYIKSCVGLCDWCQKAEASFRCPTCSTRATTQSNSVPSIEFFCSQCDEICHKLSMFTRHRRIRLALCEFCGARNQKLDIMQIKNEHCEILLCGLCQSLISSKYQSEELKLVDFKSCELCQEEEAIIHCHSCQVDLCHECEQAMHCTQNSGYLSHRRELTPRFFASISRRVT